MPADESNPPRARGRKRDPNRRTRDDLTDPVAVQQIETALQRLREQVFSVESGSVAALADADEQERVRGVLGLAEGVLRLAMTRTRVTRDERAYVDPDLSAATRCLELVAKLLGVLEVEAKQPVVLSEEQLRALMRRAGYDLVATGEEKPAG